jgi:hypothetical protein
MDSVFIEGAAAVAAGVIVFCGSVFMLLAFNMGAKLAYFVTASITLAFLLIMGLVWSVNELGPVGQLPEWDPVSIAEEDGELTGPSATDYPEGPWQEVDPEDADALTQATELQTGALDYTTAEVDKGNLPETVTDAYTANAESVRLLEDGGEQYGGVTLAPPQGDEGPEIVAIMKYDPGNPLGEARMITGATFVLLVLHLFLLGRAERQARRKREETATP